MSQDNRYQFHMGCGEPLCSQWLRATLAEPAARKTTVSRPRKTVTADKARGRRKA
ncbi:MAG: hypothetical protein OQL11_14510 [Gammaproteobacteria bacterium]|jgi:hypothetical protein|nr:hypothetical protein [Gammaproteobacteria bacterium]